MKNEDEQKRTEGAPRADFVPLRRLLGSVMSAEPGEKFEHPEHPFDPRAMGRKLDELKQGLNGDEAPRYWRSLEELAQRPEYKERVKHEFAAGVTDGPDGVSRRNFLKIMGASMALAGMTACTKQPLEPIVPYVVQPPQVTLGKPLFFASAVVWNGVAEPVLVESHEGRPTKIEGNPQHPASLGGTSPFAQAEILQMYDPDRSQTVMNYGEQRAWMDFTYAMRSFLQAQAANGGAGIRILTPTITSPSLAATMNEVLKLYPAAKWHQWEPVHNANEFEGARLAFGQPVSTLYKLENADVILTLDGDFLSATFGPGFVRYARDYGRRRKPESGNMNRLYVAENMPSNAGAKAEHRLGVRTSEVDGIARAIAAGLGINAGGAPTLNPEQQKFVSAVVKDLQAHHGKSVVIVGKNQPAAVHALAHAMNQALGAVGQTVVYTDPLAATPVNQLDSIKQLADDIHAGKVTMLLTMNSNPVFDAPADLEFETALKEKKVPLVIHHGTHQDETSYYAHWHIPATHSLEAWGDARAYDGTITIIQPLIAPLYDAAKSPHEMLAALTSNLNQTGHDIVKAYWQTQAKGDFEKFWRESLYNGFVADSALPAKTLAATSGALPAPRQLPAGVEVNFLPDPNIYDGRYVNNGWMQELPKPITRLTWDNAVMISPAMAKSFFNVDLLAKQADVPEMSEGTLAHDMWHGTIVEINLNGRKIEGAVFTVPGHADNSITVHLGYGRARTGVVGTGTGFNSFALRTIADGMDTAGGAALRNTGKVFELATTQLHHNMEGRDQVRVANLDEWKKNPEFPHEHEEAPNPDFTLYPNYKYEGYAWGMAIDNSACIGCNSCVVACVSENNIPVVGKEEVLRERQMYWLRIDSYYEGDLAAPTMYFQPIPCMQCENAPCEYVCPVGATVHSTEGLNDMVYNRCVGTRYCSNNCPYKVRRFNFFLFQDWDTPQFKLMRNPEVTVRSRGVMEKCSYCIQRIVKSRIEAEKGDRLIKDGEVQTACQQACPAEAITFGDINTGDSRVAKWKDLPRNYGVLTELNTRPRTTYLAEVRNPNPEIPEAAEQK